MAPDPAAPGGASDAWIFEGCLRGDKRCWDAFVDRFSKFVYWSLWKALATSGAPDKEEICREAFQELFRRLLEPSRMEKLAAASNPRKYLQVTAANLVLERFRRQGAAARFEVSAEEEAASAASQGASPHEDAAETERRALLAEVLDSLKPRERQCLEMHYLDGNTHAQIASLLGMPQDTVSTLIRRTREKLKERLRNKGLED